MSDTNPMSKVEEREPDFCQCGECSETVRHASDCSVHNEPALPKGPCDCGATTMSDIKDGGPAFPLFADGNAACHMSSIAHDGMSLRDWFAGMVLNGMCSAPFSEGAYPEMARQAYKMADAMLTERGKTDGE